LKRLALAAVLALAASAPVSALVMREPPPRGSYANPSAGIAADIELSRMSADKKGRWFALRKLAAPEAVIFAPQLVLAQPWLKDRHDPAAALRLQPSRAWASCDGSLIVTSGSRADAGPNGWYTNVWQRQGDGGFLWVFGHGGVLTEPFVEPDWIEGKVAECPPRPASQSRTPPPRKRGKQEKPARPAPPPFDPQRAGGASDDGSLTWEAVPLPGGAHRFTARIRGGGEMTELLGETVAADGS
jgi:hypothetical protein